MKVREIMVGQPVKGRRILVPSDPKTIELHAQQYELASKWVAYQTKLAELRTKLNDDGGHSSKVVRSMAKHASKGQSNGVYGLKGDNSK